MAERPVFLPSLESTRLVLERSFPFVWNPGMAPSQKKKNVAALHASAAEQGIAPLLEVSTKSENQLGQNLSAFNLIVELEGAPLPLEAAFQGSKVFELGGPFTDLYSAEVRKAKRDHRLRDSGRLIAFEFGKVRCPVYPKTAFYDWLYLQAVALQSGSIQDLHSFAGFTDIEFNPKRSVNCQARSCATLVSLDQRHLLSECTTSLARFLDIVARAQGDPLYSFR